MVLVTVPTVDEARAIARHLVDRQLAACVNVVSSIESIYRWQGRRCEETEWLLVIKTRASLFAQLAAEVKSLHSYSVPEIIALPIVEGAGDYLTWIQEATSRPDGAV